MSEGLFWKLSDQLTAIVKRAALAGRGTMPEDVQRLRSTCNDVFRLRFAEGSSAVLKIYSRGHGADRERCGDRAVVERQAMALLAERGVPVPPIEAEEVTAAIPWILMRDVGNYAAGRPDGLTPAEAKAVYRRCGELLGSVHQITSLDDGSQIPRHLVTDGAGAIVDPVLRWALGRARSHPLASPQLLERLSEAAMAAPAQPVLCHGDFHPDQCVRDGAHTTAVVDWESATHGDPFADHAKMANYLHVFFDPELGRQTLEGYASICVPPPATEPRYVALRALHALALSPATRPEDSYGRAWWDLAFNLTRV